MSKAHPGFKAVQAKIEREGYSKRAAGAILANASRHASKAAKKKNPRLARVSGNNGHDHVGRRLQGKSKRMAGY
jgi:hypothetical protein